MTAEQAAEKLTELGWEVEVVNGMPMVLVAREDYLLPKTIKRIAKDIKNIGYNRSYGVRPKGEHGANG